MSKWSNKVRTHGVTLNVGLHQIVTAAEKMLATKKFGGETSPITFYQGSWSGAKASAGTHSAADALDISAYNRDNRVRVFRMLGVAMWYRPTLKGVWTAHIHGITCGGAAAPAGQRQVTAYYNGRNGLANNGKDTGWRPSSLPILFKLDGDLRDRYCTTACHLYDEPAATDRRDAVAVGDKISDVAAVVNVGGKYWFITADGRCGYDDNFTTTKPTDTAPVPDPPVTVEPCPAPETPAEPTPSPQPDPAPVAEASFNALVINVGADYVPGYASRVDNIEDVRDAARASLVMTCESGNYADGEKLNKWFGWGGKRNGTVATGESFVLHGGSVPITTAVHFDPRKYDVLDEGMWTTEPGTTHRWATWALLRHNESRVIFIVAVTHLQYLPKGPNTTKKYDQERYRQLDAVFKQTKDLQAKVLKSRPELAVVPALVAGDMNSTRHDKYDDSDGVSKAARDHDFIDAATVGKDDKPIIDRIFVSPQGVSVDKHSVVPTLGGTDHKTAFAASFTLTNSTN